MVTKDSIKIVYKTSDNYNPKYINGAYGGINTRGEIIVNFYLERRDVPKSQTYKIEKDRIGKEIETEPRDLQYNIIRFVDSGIILNLDSAKSIVHWLNEKIKQLEKSKT